MKDIFIYDERLGIAIPHLEQDFSTYPSSEQNAILMRWEEIRGIIPERIKEIEGMIEQTLMQLDQEDNFEVSCALNNEMAEYASIINDLWIWYRVDQGIVSKNHL